MQNHYISSGTEIVKIVRIIVLLINSTIYKVDKKQKIM